MDRLLTADEERLDRITDAFAGVVDAKSPWTYRHSDRASPIAIGLAVALGARAGLADATSAAPRGCTTSASSRSRTGSSTSPRRLTKAEFAPVREHPVITERILDHVPGFRDLSPLAGAHHERLDGDGYPRGLTRAELSLPMRILAVADVYEALTSERPYRPARTSDQALEIMRADVPARLDAEAFSALEDLLAGASPGAAAASVLGGTSSGDRAGS